MYVCSDDGSDKEDVAANETRHTDSSSDESADNSDEVSTTELPQKQDSVCNPLYSILSFISAVYLPQLSLVIKDSCLVDANLAH